MIEHTKEPWRIGKRKNNYKIDGNKKEMEILTRLGKVSFEALSIGVDYAQIAIIPLDESNESNARRIVACVNACAGISTEDLESGNVIIVRREPIPLTPDRDPLETPE